MKLSAQYPITLLLEISGIKNSTYYKWLKRRNIKTPKDIEDEFIIEKIKELYQIHKGRYGVDRTTHALEQDYGIKHNHKKNNLIDSIQFKNI